jgi:large subunit ribosomal protein L15
MSFKKRKKTTRFRGSHTHGRGFKKKARGSGHRGGVGMAGTGKRGDAKKTMVINLFGNDYFGKEKTWRRGKLVPKAPVINLSDIVERLDFLVKLGKAKETKGSYDLDLSDYKILGVLDEKIKLTIKAKAASASAIESVKKAGGEIVLAKAKEKTEKKAPVKKEENK